ncbi:hypothetical protein FA95DRAFT_1605089 [Auriscalpium vulgare]|uniref:Uncharacterized protein n=1 Tax=Auriscalpium vulgare TaxID=40419 RepID=A0ACB8RWN0_9AGAM|nr:hypothetical protein FA95DRAFT_1605089 [Auriscalpium vulgare]
MSHQPTARASQLEDELCDARRTIDALEDRLRFLEGHSTKQTERLTLDLAASRTHRDKLQDELRVLREQQQVLQVQERAHVGTVARLNEDIRAQTEAADIARRAAAKMSDELKREADLRCKAEKNLRDALEREREREKSMRAAEAERTAAETMHQRLLDRVKELEEMSRLPLTPLPVIDEAIRPPAEDASDAEPRQSLSHPQHHFPTPPLHDAFDSAAAPGTYGAVNEEDDEDGLYLDLAPVAAPPAVQIPVDDVIYSGRKEDVEMLEYHASPRPSHLPPPSLLPPSLLALVKMDPWKTEEKPLRPEKRPLEAEEPVDPFASNSPLTTPPRSEIPAPTVKRHKFEAGTPEILSAQPSSSNATAGPSTPLHRRPAALRNLLASLAARIANIHSIAVPPSHLAPPPAILPRSGGGGYVRRNLISAKCGGNPQSFLTTVSGARNLPRATREDRHLLFPNWEQNPGLPEVPGQPGTLIANRLDIMKEPYVGVFVRADGVPVWLYMGNYKLEMSEQPLSADEFKALPQKTRNAWADALLAPQSWKCYTSMRARVWLRKNGREVAEEAVEAARRPGALANAMGLERKDMLAALDSGEEILHVMLCVPVSYDAEFQEALTAAQEEAAQPESGHTKPSVRTSRGKSKRAVKPKQVSLKTKDVDPVPQERRRSARHVPRKMRTPEGEDSAEEGSLGAVDEDGDYTE